MKDWLAPAYWDAACAELAARDPVLAALIPQYGPAKLASHGDAFVTLARSIVGQQISVIAAQAVWDRLAAAVPAMTPAAVFAQQAETLAGCGLSRRKVEYLQDLAGHFASGAVDASRWPAADDEAVIAELTAIRGIGRWTAEMFLIFHLLRPNVLPLDDLGLLKAIAIHYRGGEPVGRAAARTLAEQWAPWRTVATWYLWRSLDPVPVAY